MNLPYRWCKRSLTLVVRGCYKNKAETNQDFPGGAVAQLGARLDGIEEVVGSNPIGSTNFALKLLPKSDRCF